jgi:hypothetical protein
VSSVVESLTILRVEKGGEMKRAWLIALGPAVVGLFVLALLLIKALWAWVIPDIFPGAIDQGLIAGSISWFTAFKIAIFVGVLGGFHGTFRQSRGSRRRRPDNVTSE